MIIYVCYMGENCEWEKEKIVGGEGTKKEKKKKKRGLRRENQPAWTKCPFVFRLGPVFITSLSSFSLYLSIHSFASSFFLSSFHPFCGERWWKLKGQNIYTLPFSFFFCVYISKHSFQFFSYSWKQY